MKLWRRHRVHAVGFSVLRASRELTKKLIAARVAKHQVFAFVELLITVMEQFASRKSSLCSYFTLFYLQLQLCCLLKYLSNQFAREASEERNHAVLEFVYSYH
jgi:hypothetical protein